MESPKTGPSYSDEDFEKSLAQMCRFYRALREIYSTVDASKETELVKWVIVGGRILESMAQQIAAVEAYSGSSDLRLVVAEFKLIRKSKEVGVEETSTSEEI